MIAEYKVYQNMDLHQKLRAMAKNITVVSPDTPEELLLIVKQLKKFIQSSLDSCPVSNILRSLNKINLICILELLLVQQNNIHLLFFLTGSCNYHRQSFFFNCIIKRYIT